MEGQKTEDQIRPGTARQVEESEKSDTFQTLSRYLVFRCFVLLASGCRNGGGGNCGGHDDEGHGEGHGHGGGDDDDDDDGDDDDDDSDDGGGHDDCDGFDNNALGKCQKQTVREPEKGKGWP